MSTFNYIQMPPNGTGKKSKQTVIIGVSFINGVNSFEVGDTVETDDGFVGDVTLISGNVVNGTIQILVHHDSASAEIPVGTTLKVDGVTYAETSALPDARYNQDVVITGGNNPLNKVHVNETGALKADFSTGAPLFDAFGKLQVSETTTIREYQPVADTLPNEFTETTENGATIDWDDTRHVVVMTNPTTMGARSLRRTNLYHKYQTGVATTILWSAFSGGELNGVTRRMGFFDDEDGIFCQSVDETISVCIRSSVTGSIVENVVPRSEWNVDRLDRS